MRKIVTALFHRLVGRYGQLVLQYRSVLVIFTQLVLIAAANVTAFTFRFEGDIPPDYARLMLWGFPIVLAIYAVGLVAFGIHHGTDDGGPENTA